MNDLEIIRDLLLEHKDENNQITAAEIATTLGYYNEDDTHAKTRALVKKCIKEYYLPVRGTDNGYYYMTKRSDLDKYIDNLNGRIEKIAERRDMVIKNFEENNI